MNTIDPLALASTLWPEVHFFREQREIIRSVWECDETFVVAAHQVGKDFVLAATALLYFLLHHPVRIVITSVKDDHLRVSFGELGRFIDTSAYPLKREKGGPLIVNHREIRKVVRGEVCKISYLIGCVSARGEGLAGHHAPHTLLCVDEASGVDDEVYTRGSTWAKRVLCIGNPYPCQNFFKSAVEGGDVEVKS